MKRSALNPGDNARGISPGSSDPDNAALKKELEESRKLNKKYLQQIDQLKKLTQGLKEGFANSEDALAIIGISDGENHLRVIDMNQAARELFKHNGEKEFYVKDLLSEKNYRTFIDKYLPKLKKGISVTFKGENENGEGYWDSTIYPVFDGEGNVVNIISISKNVSSEHENVRLAAILQAAIDSLPYEVWIRDASGYEIYQNKISRENVGDKIGTTLNDLNFSANSLKYHKNIEKRILSGERFSNEIYSEKDDKRRWSEAVFSPIWSGDNIIGYTTVISDITNRKLSENSLRKNEARFRLIARHSKNMVYDYNLITGVIEWDGAIEEVTGFTPGEFRDFRFENWIQMIHPDDKDDVINSFETTRKQEKVYKTQYRYRKKNGEYIWIEDESSATEFVKGNPSRIMGIMKDINERKTADEIIYKNQKLLNDSHRIARIGVWEYYYRDDLLIWNEDTCRIFGIEKFDHVPAIEDYIHLVHPDDRDRVITHFEETVHENEYKDLEYRIVRPDGEIRSVITVGALNLDERGNAYRAFGIVQDITERRLNEEKIRNSEERYDLVTNLSGYVVFDQDIQGRKVKWAGAIKELTGYSQEEISTIQVDEILKLFHPEDLGVVMSPDNYKGNSISKKLQYRFRKKDNGYIWVEANAFLFRDKNGNPLRWLGIMRDVTEQKRIHELIEESEEKLRKIFDASKDGIIVITNDLKIVELNSSVLSRTGYSHNEITGAGLEKILSEEGVNLVKQFIASDRKADAYINVEGKVKMKGGGTFPIELNITDIHLRDQDAFLVMARDISERKQMERELLNSVITTEERERLHFSQELHDGLGPLLSAARLYVEWLADPTPDVDTDKIILDVWKILEESNKSIREISFKLSPHILQNHGLIEALKAYADRMEQTGKTKIKITSTITGRFDKTTETIVYRVICECINNTIKHARARKISIRLALRGSMLGITYSDDGTGFDVASTVKERRGIGLLNMQSRINAVNGTLSFISTEGKGTKIRITIPVIL